MSTGITIVFTFSFPGPADSPGEARDRAARNAPFPPGPSRLAPARPQGRRGRGACIIGYFVDSQQDHGTLKSTS